MTIMTLLLMLWAHFIGDFILQSDKMALSKSSSNKWLSLHVLIYILPFVVVLWTWNFVWVYVLTNAVLHFVVDYITSRAASRLWKADKRHWFFVVIGLDQVLHLNILLVTFAYFALNWH